MDEDNPLSVLLRRQAVMQELRGDAQGPVQRTPEPLPAWKQYAQSIFDNGVDLITGALGIPTGMQETKGSLLGQLLTAGLPLAGGIRKVTKPIKAYHGSPHDFDQFDLSKIGTVEGAQAYGHGLYFAEKEGTAKAYRDALAPPEVRVGGKPHPALNTESPVDMAIADLANGKPMSDEVLARGFDPRFAQEYKQAVQKYQGQVERVNPGRMYEVQINADPEDFLDWDAPLSQQSEKVKRAIGSGEYPSRFNRESVDRALAGNETPYDRDWNPTDGSAFYRQLANAVPGKAGEAAESLKARGLAGIKYLDGGSRAAGEGSRNYVVFDDKLISIVKKYGIAGALAAGLINETQARQMQEQGLQ
jgi:hypothetical protein